jgi:3-oxoacyl-[acyl-carrier-protein] synthase-3
MSKTSHRTRIQLERLTGIHERRVVGPGEDSFTLAASPWPPGPPATA